MALIGRADPVEAEQIGGEEGRRDQRAVDGDLGEAARVDRELPRPRLAAVVGVGQEGAELDQQREGDEDPDGGHPAVAEGLVGETRRSEAGRDQREQDDGSGLGDSE